MLLGRFQLRLKVNRGKGFSFETAEFVAQSDPSTLVAFNAAQYELYRKGMHSLLTPEKVTTSILHNLVTTTVSYYV